MRKLKTALSFLILISFTFCKNEQTPKSSMIFYRDPKSEFVKSDLIKFSYDYRGGFTYGSPDSMNFFRVLISADSSLKVFGIKSFCHFFNTNFDSIDLSEMTFEENFPFGGILIIKSNNRSFKRYINYFLSLKTVIDKYQILAIEGHPVVNIKEIIFSNNDYLIYKPDTLIFVNRDKGFMKYLFRNGRPLDKNWIQFDDTINTDYY
jgi:hypothetical protein